MKEQFVIGRPIEGVYLNGIEFLMEDNNDVKVFDDILDAKNFVVENIGVDSLDAEDYIFTKDFYDGNNC
jgi:hypothetical protein